MSKNVLVLEDNVHARLMLQKILRRIDINLNVYCFSSADEALTKALEITFDVFLVDIILNTSIAGDVSGFIFAEKIRLIKKYGFTPIIFITSLQDLHNSSYRLIHAYEYIEKPFDQEAVARTIKTALQYTTPREHTKYISFRKDGIMYSFNVAQIVYTEVGRHVMTVYGRDKKLEVPYMTCDKFLKQADSGMFLKISRNTIVNREYIEYTDGRNRLIKLQGYDEPVLIGITYVKKVMEELVHGFENILDS